MPGVTLEWCHRVIHRININQDSCTSNLNCAIAGVSNLQTAASDFASNRQCHNQWYLQSYGAASLGADTTLTSSGNNNITFNSTINGAHALAVNTTGVTTFSGIIGGSTPLSSLTTNAGGSTQIDANVSTTSTQSYGDAVSLGTDITLTGAGITLSGVTGNAHQLTLTDSGTSNLNGAIAGVSNLQTAAVTFGNGSVTTSGTQSYGAASLGADTTLTSSGNNNITFNSTINGAHALARLIQQASQPLVVSSVHLPHSVA